MKKAGLMRYVLPLVLGLAFAQPALAQSADPAPSAPQADSQKASKQAISVPTAAEGAELLKSENIAFEPDNSPMPDVAATVRSARKTKDASSMFITHMMYRDHVGDIAYYNNGKKQETELSPEEQHREMIRWRDAAFEANYELAILATTPSVQYEISPMFSDDDEFKKGLKYLKKAAAHGYGNAEYILGLIHFNGVGAKRDKKKGFELLVRAAAHGVVNAYYAVGMIYEMGLNGKKDTEKSLYWLEKAEQYGSHDAAFILAMKYADGIDVPKNKAKADLLAKFEMYHAWTMMYYNAYGSFSHRYCTEHYDESDVGTSNYEGGCSSTVRYVDRFGTRTNNDYDEDDEKEDSIEEVASHSLDYKIDYRIAALWLKKVTNFDREHAYILRSQIHHTTGCHGGLDGDDFGEIIISPEENSWDDYDEYPLSYKKIVVALNDYDAKPSMLKKWLISRADEGDLEAMKTLAMLYDRRNYEIYKVNSASGGDYHYGDEIKDVDYNDDMESLPKELLGYKSEPTRSEVKANLKKAFEYYEKGNFYASAIRDAELLGSDLKNSNYDRIPKGQVTIDWFEKAFEMSEKGYLHYMQTNDFENARKFAERAANIMRKLDKKSDAVTWYMRALDVNSKVEKQTSKHGLFRFKNSMRLARLYQDGADAKNDQTVKIIKLYKDVLHSVNSLFYEVAWNDEGYAVPDIGEKLDDVAMDLLNTAVRIGEMSEQAAGNHSGKQASDKLLAVEAYQRVSELDYYISSLDNKDIKLPKDAIAHARKLIEALPKYDLQKEVEKQILAEKGKNADKFYIFDKILSLCDKELDDTEWYDDGKYLYCAYEVTGEGEDWCAYRTCRIDDPYQESVDKVVVALTAFSLANGALDIEMIKNTFYDLAIYKTWLRLSPDVAESSAVYLKLKKHLLNRTDNSSNYTFSDYDERRLFHIWYLRQIPYAAADKFKKLKSDKKWDEYMQEAKDLIQKTPELRNAFGYDPAMPVQRFP